MLGTSPPTALGDRASIAPIVAFEFWVRGDALLIYRRGADNGFHCRSDPADHPVPDLLLVIEPGNRGPKSNHLNDLKPAVRFDECSRTITTVLVH